MVEIRAAVCHRFGEPFSVETVSLADPGPGEVRVTVRACAICHSDITYADGGWGGDLPMVLGHEAAGIVESTGAGVTAFKPGDPVIATLIRACGTCHYCSGDNDFLCEAVTPLDRHSPIIASDGAPVAHGLRTGAFAEAIVVDQSQLAKIPATMDLDVASLLSCGILTGVGAVTNTARMPAGSHAVIIGCGGVGLAAVQGARLAGAATITAIDVVAAKRNLAKTFGATHAVDGSDENAVARVWQIAEGRGADYVFVTVGSGPVIEKAMDYLGRKGTLVIVGMPDADVMTKINPASFASYGQSVLGSKMGSAKLARDIPWLIERYQAGELLLDEMITARYPLEKINEAIADTRSGGSIRNVIVFD